MSESDSGDNMYPDLDWQSGLNAFNELLKAVGAVPGVITTQITLHPTRIPAADAPQVAGSIGAIACVTAAATGGEAPGFVNLSIYHPWNRPKTRFCDFVRL